MSESLSFTGTIIEIGQEQQITDNFKKVEFVLSDQNEQYEQEIAFQLAQDKCDLIDPYSVGQKVKVSFNLRGKRWLNPKTDETKFFTTLDAWRLEKVDGNANKPQMPIAGDNTAAIEANDKKRIAELSANTDFDDGSDDLPF